jgi:rod shape-determining protein MreD
VGARTGSRRVDDDHHDDAGTADLGTRVVRDPDDERPLMRAWRLSLLVVLVVIVQVTVFPHLRILGVVPDLGLVLAVAVAYRYGPEAGAIVGFAAGLGYDLFLETPLGMSALAYALTAYGVGVLQTGMLRSPRWIPPLLGGAAGLACGLAFVGIGGLVGVEGMWTTRALEVVGLAALYDALIAPLVFLLVTVISRRERETVGAWSIHGPN